MDCGGIFARRGWIFAHSDAGEKMDSRAADGGEGFPRRGRGRRGLRAADLKTLEEKLPDGDEAGDLAHRRTCELSDEQVAGSNIFASSLSST